MIKAQDKLASQRIHESQRVNSTPSTDWRALLTRSVLFPWARRYGDSREDYVCTELRGYLRGRILDVGAGSSAAVYRERIGPSYEPLDLEHSYKFDGTPTDARQGHSVVDLEHQPLPYPDQTFDTVMCIAALEHLDNIYATYDELFRIAREFVIIQLPNNWPLLLGSLIRGHHITHRAGYGLPPQPKPAGKRHKYFFNFEEACDFLISRMPDGFVLEKLDPRFESGSDGILFCLFPRGTSPVRRMENLTLEKAIRRFGLIPGFLLFLAKALFYWPLRLLDALLCALLWGWGNPVRYYNLFCRGVWVVFRRI